MSEAAFTIEIESDLHSELVAAAAASHRTAAQVVRHLIREFIDESAERLDYVAFLEAKVGRAHDDAAAGRIRSHADVERDFAARWAPLVS